MDIQSQLIDRIKRNFNTNKIIPLKSINQTQNLFVKTNHNIGEGSSSTFFTQVNDYNTEVHPFIHSPTNSSLFLDIGLGYFHEALNAIAVIAYRNMKTVVKANNYEQHLIRKSLAIEFNKFFLIMKVLFHI